MEDKDWLKGLQNKMKDYEEPLVDGYLPHPGLERALATVVKFAQRREDLDETVLKDITQVIAVRQITGTGGRKISGVAVIDLPHRSPVAFPCQIDKIPFYVSRQCSHSKRLMWRMNKEGERGRPATLSYSFISQTSTKEIWSSTSLWRFCHPDSPSSGG